MYKNPYKISICSDRKMKRLIQEYLNTLKAKYLPKQLTSFFKVGFSLESHLAQRVLERKVDKAAFERLVTSLIRDKLCEVIYLSLAKDSVRINLQDKTGLLLGVTGRHYEDGVFNIKLHTCFIPDKGYKAKLVRNEFIMINKEEETQ